MRGQVPTNGFVTSRPARALAALALACVLVLLLPPEALARTFTVTSTKDGGKGSLRRAIDAANARAGDDVVVFDLPGRRVGTIVPASPLPLVTDTLKIDGYTQTGARRNAAATGTAAKLRVQLDGSAAGTGSEGLSYVTGAEGSRVSGLAIFGFGGTGIVLDAADCIVDGNFVGVDARGNARGNAGDGVLVQEAASTVGGTSRGSRNLVSANGSDGVEISLSNTGPDGSRVLGNLIGTDAAGTADRGNGGNGVLVDSVDNVIGGTSGGGNVISGNDDFGVQFSNRTARNSVHGNRIGTSAAGNSRIANDFGGVAVLGTTNSVGGSGEGEGNLISGNASTGVSLGGTSNDVLGNKVGTDADGDADLGNGGFGVSVSGSGHDIGGPGAGNVVSGNDGGGVRVSNGTDTEVVGNLIGLSADGDADLGNSGPGITLDFTAPESTIGGTTAGAGNVVSGNSGLGIEINSPNNTLQGNSVGTDITGTEDLGNDADGVRVSNLSNTIGGSAVGAGNVVSGNGQSGIVVAANENDVLGNRIGTDAGGTEDVGNTGVGLAVGGNENSVGGALAGEGNVVSGNEGGGISIFGSTNGVVGNHVGTDAAGEARLGNRFGGVFVFGSNNDIGGTASGAGNVISANGGVGLQIQGSGNPTVSDNEVLGNRIGTDADGETDLGNAFGGVSVANASNNTIGGTTSGAGNVVSANGGSGITLSAGATGTGVRGNRIGVGASGGALGNSEHGVLVDGGTGNSIGGTASGAGNTIFRNGRDGVSVSGATATGNSVLGNSLVSNGTLATHLGIDLGTDGVTANDSDDPDTGPNNLQNFPVITSATRSAATNLTTISGTLNSVPSQQFVIECHLVTAPDPSGHGEGVAPLGRVTVTTNTGGDASFTCPATGAPQPGLQVTATATRTSTGDTSEFAQNRSVTTAP